jgi:glycosyltransferase involved in cell wall biosynthesis
MHVAFVNENTLGHASYLGPLVRGFRERPEHGIVPHVIDAAPLVEPWKKWGEFSIRGLRRFGLDFHCSRWRFSASRQVRNRLDELRKTQSLDAVIVNTQSVGLCLADLAEEVPVFVAMDATFRQLEASPWFGPNRISRWAQPLTMRALRKGEQTLFRGAAGFFPWSAHVKQSLIRDYGIGEERIHWLPPSISMQPTTIEWPRNARPQILFMGGDFQRKGGPVLMECYHRHLADRFDLHVVTQSDVPKMQGVHVHHGVAAYSPQWFERWQQADVFVFPSRLETFGIVLLEALAFQVPVVSSDVGAAREVLLEGNAGVLIPPDNSERLANAIEYIFQEPKQTRARIKSGHDNVEANYSLPVCLPKLAALLHHSMRK